MVHKNNKETNKGKNKEIYSKNSSKGLFADSEEMEKGIDRIMGIDEKDH